MTAWISLIIQIPNYDNPDWKISTGDALTCACNYQYLIASSARSVFLEDREVLEAVHTGMANATNRPVNLGLDAAALHFRRNLERMISLESGDST